MTLYKRILSVVLALVFIFTLCIVPALADTKLKQGDKYGDTNLDKNVDISDVTCLQRYLSNLYYVEDRNYFKTINDLNNDNLIDIIDASLLQKYLVGDISKIPLEVEEPTSAQGPINDVDGYNNHIYRP